MAIHPNFLKAALYKKAWFVSEFPKAETLPQCLNFCAVPLHPLD